jgi:ribokinase
MYDVLTVGSVHLDQRYLVDALPRAGETTVARSASQGLGGKGANQAVAAARAGVRSALVGFVGTDTSSQYLLDQLTRLGVDVSGVIQVPDSCAGSAVVLCDLAGENQIVVNPGANALGDVPDSRLRATVARTRVLVLQGETPVPLSQRAAQAADDLGVLMVVNLAPVVDLGPVLRLADPLVVNEVEAAQLLDLPVGPERAAVWLADALGGRARSVVVTVGAQGAAYAYDGQVRHVAAPPVPSVVDTTGAGDAFVGVLAAMLARDMTLADAVERAVRAASSSVQFVGAAESYPSFGGLS